MSVLLSDAQLRHFTEHGYVVVPDLLPVEDVEAFLARDREFGEARPAGLQNHQTHESYTAIARHASVVGKIRQLVGGAPRVVQTMYMAKPPEGGTGVALHQDTHYIRNEPNTLTACWMAFSQTGPDNGGLVVAPGSHKEGLLSAGRVRESDQHADWEQDYEMRGPDGEQWSQTMTSHDIYAYGPDNVEHLEVAPGGGVFFSSLTVHGSYANKTADHPRLAFATHYVREDSWVYRADLQDLVPAD
ncbi:MAG: hypothetical protein HN712_05875 [Gemmatimonadetes bacterium]|nr:hypothetical protein [Gemmatimonadota bacterium]